MLTLLVAFMAACGSSSSSSSSSTSVGGGGDNGGGDATTTLTIGMIPVSDNLDPATLGPGYTGVIPSIAYEPLIKWNLDGSFSPGLAEEWNYVGKGSKQFELTLRKDAKFSDGTPVTAQAVKDWLEYFPTQMGPSAANMPPIGKVETDGKWTVRIFMESGNPIMPITLSEPFGWGNVASPKAVANPKSLSTQTYGAGQYTFDPDESVTGNVLTFVPNEYYYDKSQIRFGKIVIRIYKTSSSMLQAAEAGQVDVAYGDPTTAEAAESADLNVVSSPFGSSGIVFPDLAGEVLEPLADVRVRRALNYAIDREAISEGLLGKYGEPSSQFWTPDGYDEKYVSHYPYDQEKAEKLLAEAGYPDGFTMPVLVSGFIGVEGTPMVQAMAKYLEAVGVKVDMEIADTQNELFTKFFEAKWPTANFGLGLPMWTFYKWFLDPEAKLVNQHGFEDPEMKRLWESASTMAGADEQAAAVWKAMSARSVTQAYFLPVSTSPRILYVNDAIGGVEASDMVLTIPPHWFPQ